MADWHYYNPVDVRFGPGCLAELSEVVAGSETLLLTSPGSTRRGLTQRVCEHLIGRDVIVDDGVEANPGIDELDLRIERLAHPSFDSIVAVGGGSVLDTAKVVAAGVVHRTAGGPTVSEHFRDGIPMHLNGCVPVYAVPTTAGTGSEVTPFATVWDKESKRKYSLSGRSLFPRIAIVDPELTYDLPRDVTLSGGLDALVQGFEAIWNRNATPLTNIIASKVVGLAIKSLATVVNHPDNRDSRTAMMQASLLSGLVISQTRTALAHALSYPLTAHLQMPHGLACGFWLLPVLRFNREQDDGRLDVLERELGFEDGQSLEQRVKRLFAELNVYSLFASFVPTLENLNVIRVDSLVRTRAENNLRIARLSDIEVLAKLACELVTNGSTNV